MAPNRLECTIASLEIPDALSDLTPQWMTAALRAGGVIGEVSVTACVAVVIAADRGIGGRVARVTLTYDRPHASAPATLVAKLPSVIPLTRGGGRYMRLPERELRFYRELRDGVPLASPRCYYAAVDTAGDAFVLLLEDLRGFLAGDDLAGLSLDRIAAVIDTLAELHATWWRDARLESLDWMPRIHDRGELWQRMYGGAWEELRGETRGLVPAEMEPLAERLRAHVITVVDRLAAAPATLLHGDLRLDNLFFPATPDRPKVIAVDWSNATRGPGAYDVAYLLCTALTPEQRRAHERSLLARYHGGLIARGVQHYDLAQCFDDYRLSFLEPFARLFALLARGHAEKHEARPQRVLERVVRHAAQAAVDLDAGTLLDA